MSFDTVLAGGRVIDPETKFDEICDVGIKGGIITKIGQIGDAEKQGADTIDCSCGLVVAPGFIDTHAHGQDDYSSELQCCDGVTTHLEMEFGAFPVAPFYDARAGRSIINYGCTVGHMIAAAAEQDQ